MYAHVCEKKGPASAASASAFTAFTHNALLFKAHLKGQYDEGERYSTLQAYDYISYKHKIYNLTRNLSISSTHPIRENQPRSIEKTFCYFSLLFLSYLYIITIFVPKLNKRSA